ncbi:hypothetical protein ACFLYO_08040 [Chloroflexota bacterium]
MSEQQERSTYRVSPRVQHNFDGQKHRYAWRRMQSPRMTQRRYWTHSQRAYNNDLIRGGHLVAHRRMFGVSHKSVQVGQTPPSVND